MQDQPKRVVMAAVDDLFFATRIGSTAARLPLKLVEVRDAAQLAAELAAVTPDLVIFDLNSTACEPISAIRRIRADPRFHATRLVGFLSHMQEDLTREASAAGCDTVLPRSRFSAGLARILLEGK